MDTKVNESTDSQTQGNKKTKVAQTIERLLKWLFLASFILLILAQSLLTYPSIRSLFNKEAADGEPLGYETYLFEPCKLELKLNNIEYCPDIKVMVNGDEICDFSNDTIILDLKPGDVVELDASRLLIHADVVISAVSSNLTELLGRSFAVTGGIVHIATVNAMS